MSAVAARRVGSLTAAVAVLALTALTAGLVLKPARATATPANTINFQARLETAAGAIANDGNYNVEFKLYSASSGGSALWTEDYLVGSGNGIRTANGYLTANLGSITAFPSSIPWGQQLYLTMNIGGTGSSASWDGEMSPRLSLTSVPSAFALNSYNSSNGFTGSLSVAQPTGGNQLFVVPDQGAAGSYSLLTTQTANTSFIQSQLGGVQATSNFWISGTGRAATALQSPAFDTPSAGALTIGASTATSVSIGRSGITTTVAGLLTAGAGLTVSAGSTPFTNNASTVFVPVSVTISGGSVGSAASTVDVASTLNVTVTGDNQTVTLPSPTNTAAGRVLYVANVGSKTFTVGTTSLIAHAATTFIWDGSQWASAAANGISNAYIVNGTSLQSSASFNIDGSGQVGTIFTAGGLVTGSVGFAGPSLDTVSAGGTLSVGSTNATTVNIGNGASATTTNIGTNSAAAATINAGSTNTGTTVKLQAGVSSATLSNIGLSVVSTNTSGVALTVQGTQSTAPLGSELASQDFTTYTNTGWSTTSTQASHSNGGGTSQLSTNVNVTSGQTYQLEFTISNLSTGSPTVTLGTVTVNNNGSRTNFDGNGTYKRTVVAAASGTVSLAFTPTNDFNGTISAVTLKQVTGSALAVARFNSSDGSSGIEVRTGGSQGSLYLGYNSGKAVTSGSSNVGVGGYALQSNTTGTSNTAVGTYALANNTTGANNVALGTSALQANTTGSGNQAIGQWALLANTTGSGNSAIGQQALQSNTTGSNNSAFGLYSTLFNTTGGSNSAFGAYSLYNNTTGSNNVAFGSAAMLANTTGGQNTAIGQNSFRASTTANYNVGLGAGTGASNVTGANNLYVGAFAGVNATGTGNVFLGYQAGGNVTSGDNKLFIANSNTATPLIQGDFSAATLTVNGAQTVTGTLGVTGTSTLTGLLTANGGLTVTGASALNGQLTVTSQSNTAIAAIIKGASSQSGDLLQFQNGSGSVLAGHNSLGQLYYNSGSYSGTLVQGTLSGTRTYTLPDASGTICLDSSVNNCSYAPTTGGTGYIQNQNSSTQSANFSIQGSVTNAATASIKANGTGDILDLYSSGAGSAVLAVNYQGNVYASSKVCINNANCAGALGVNGLSGTSAALYAISYAGGSTPAAILRQGYNSTGDLQQFMGSKGDVLGLVDVNGNQVNYGTNLTLSPIASPTPTLTAGTAGSAYYYAIAAYSNQGTALPGTAIGTTSNSGVTFTWTKSNGAQGYKIYRSTTNNFAAGATVTLVGQFYDGGGTSALTFTDSATSGSNVTIANPAGTALTIQGWSGQTGSALKVQNAAGNTNFSVDANGGVYSATTVNAASSIYSTYGDLLSNSGSLIAGAYSSVRGQLGKNGTSNIGLYLGDSSSYDTNLYRVSAGNLRSNSNVTLDGNLTVSGSTIALGSSSSAITTIQGNTAVTLNTTAGSTAVCQNSSGYLSTCNGGGSSVTGSGTTNYVARFTGSSTLGTGVLYDDGTFAGVNTTSQIGSGTLSVVAASSKVGLTVKGSGSDIADFISSGGNVVASVDASGNFTAVNGAFSGTFSATGATTLSSTLAVAGLASANANLVVKATSNTGSAFTLQDSSGSTALEVRTGAAADNNTFIGTNSGKNNTAGSGKSNTALGSGALQANTTGASNAAIGVNALSNNTTGNNNVAIGSSALYSNGTGGGNIAIGASTLQFGSGGGGNIAIGTQSLYQGGSAAGNSALGQYSLLNTSSGGNNTALGNYAGFRITTGNYNSFLGGLAGYQDSGNRFSTSASISQATAIGAYAQVQATQFL